MTKTHVMDINDVEDGLKIAMYCSCNFVLDLARLKPSISLGNMAGLHRGFEVPRQNFNIVRI